MIGPFMNQTLSRRWRIAPVIPPSVQQQLHELHPVVAQVLYNRGVSDATGARQFLQGAPLDVNPFDLADMNKAVARIRQAIREQEPIAVYGDFDTDGVTATALMVQTLRALGAVVEPYIPHRIEEGYGLNTTALSMLAQDGFRLVITVDCGIRDVEAVADSVLLGLDMIVTDHHAVGPQLPGALAVINPKREGCRFPEKMLAGVGVAYFLADALLRAAKAAGEPVTLDAGDLLDLVAIGTVADLAPLAPPPLEQRTPAGNTDHLHLVNRTLVRRGLEVLNSARRPGLFALIEAAGLRPGQVTSTSIGFALGPRLNAAGRLESASQACELLLTNDLNEAVTLAAELNALNVRRQDETRLAQIKVRELALAELEGDLPLIFAADRSFPAGLVGLVAGRLAEEFYRPAVVIEVGEDECRGSCRSIPEFDIIRALDECADLLIRHGGHSQAAGFSVRRENLFDLKDRLFQLAEEQLRGQELRPALMIDAEVPLEQITLELARMLEYLEPFGHRNPQPLLMTSNMQILDSRRVGKDGAHLKLTLGEMGFRIDAIAFRLGERMDSLPRRVDVVYHLEVNEWNGRRKPQLNVRDIRPAN